MELNINYGEKKFRLSWRAVGLTWRGNLLLTIAAYSSPQYTVYRISTKWLGKADSSREQLTGRFGTHS